MPMHSPTPPDGAPVALQLDAYLPYRLSVASNEVSRLIARAYEDRFGLTIPQWRLICILAEDGPSTPQSIVARTASDKVVISRAAQALTTRRLIRRRPNAADGRSHHLELTETGRHLHEEVAPLALRYEQDVIAGLSPEDIEGLKRLLRRIEQTAARLAADSFK
jgi:DNA-binding MarR family transcriptional regulator